MHLIYVYSGCSPQKYKEYIESKNLRNQQQAQKYNQLLMEGLVENGVKVTAVSSRPINRAVDKKLFFKSERDCAKGIEYRYVSFINYPILRNFTVFWNVFFKLLFTKKTKDTVFVCDALNIASSCASLIVSKLRGIKNVGIITDVPCHRPSNAKVPMHEKINLWLMKRFDSYLLLTEQMNLIVNPKKRPYIVLEGHSDVNMEKAQNLLAEKYPNKVCFYAGTLRRVYGIADLVHGFIEANVPGTELHIYGNGDFVSELKELANKYDNVKYMGIAPNEEIVKAELKATLLVNPRPTHEDYTKYSFPSKNMEYMASGTPVLTTKLPGMPADHLEHVYLIEEENAKGIARALGALLTKSSEELHDKGTKAKNFVLKEKNNVKQAEKLVTMLETMLS